MSLCCGKRVRSKKTAKNTEVIERTVPEVSSPKNPSSLRTKENHLHKNESRDFLTVAAEDSSLRRRDHLLEDNKTHPPVAVEEGKGDERGMGSRGTGRECAVVLSTFKSPSPQPFVETQSPAIDGYSDYDNTGGVGLDLISEIQTAARGDFDFSRRGETVQKQSSSDSGISASTGHSLASKADKASDPAAAEAVNRADLELDMVIEMMNSMVESTCVPAASKRSLDATKVDHSKDASSSSLKHSLHQKKNLSDVRSPESMKLSTLLSSMEIQKQTLKGRDVDRAFDRQQPRDGGSIAGIPSAANRPLLLHHHSPTEDNDDASSSSSPPCVVAETATTMTMSSSSVESGSLRSSPSTVPSVSGRATDEVDDDGKLQDHLMRDSAAFTAPNQVTEAEVNPTKDCVNGLSNSNAAQSPSKFRENSIQFATSNCPQKTKHDDHSPLQSSSQTTAEQESSRGSAFEANSAKERLESDSSSIDSILENNSETTTAGGQFKVHRLDVLKATSKLLDFVKEIWRKQGSLHHNLPKINLLCLHLKNHLQELENFGLRLVSNASDEKRLALEKKLLSHTKLLQNVRKGINRYIKSLELETVETVAQGQLQLGVDDQLKTKVGNIILLTRVIPGLVRAFGSFVDDLADSSTEKSVRNDSVISSDEGKRVTPQSSGDSCEGKAEFSESSLPKNETDKRLQKDDSVQTPPALPPKQNRSKNRSNIETGSVLTANHMDILESDSSLVATEDSNSLSARSSTTSSESLVESVSSHDQRRHRGLDAVGSAEVVLRRTTPKTPSDGSRRDNEAAYDNFSDSEISTPDIRASGVSLTVQEQLEELRRQAKGRSVQLHTDNDGDFCDYDIPAGIMEESLPDLCESDRKLLLFYSDEMFNHWKVLDAAASAFFHCIENSQPPKVFVMHSRFVIVAGHKMTYIGDVLARSLEDGDARDRLLDCCNRLCDRLKNGVRKTKEAALAYPAVASLQLMVDAVKDITDSAFELRELLFRLAYIGKADQSFPWQAIN